MFINDQSSFDRWLTQFNPVSYVGIDTEFIRTDTFFPKIVLFQISSLTETAVIDVLSVDIRPLIEKISDSSLIKIFFSGRQDLEGIFYQYDQLLYPVFDIQIACDFLSYRSNISLAEVIKELCHVHLEKTHQNIPWDERPLSEEAIEYAHNDSHYLIPLFKLMRRKLKAVSRYHWALEESCYTLTQIMDQGDIYFERNIFTPLSKRSPFEKQLTLWREHYARFKNVPRKTVFGNETIKTLSEKKLWEITSLGSDVFYLKQPEFAKYQRLLKNLLKIGKKYNIPKRYFYFPSEIIKWILFPKEANLYLEGWRRFLLEKENIF